MPLEINTTSEYPYVISSSNYAHKKYTNILQSYPSPNTYVVKSCKFYPHPQVCLHWRLRCIREHLLYVEPLKVCEHHRSDLQEER